VSAVEDEVAGDRRRVALEMSDKGAKAKQAADKAADALARRLVELYQVA
jgi:hypothetical protein